MDQEEIVKKYFESWLRKDAACLADLFAADAVYSECYGPEYFGLGQIRQWFQDWNKRGTVLKWEIKQFVRQKNTVAVEWYFECDYAGEHSSFDGVSLIEFNEASKIVHVKEFQSKSEHSFPYGRL